MIINPFISICIPTYKRLEYLKRLISSIQLQTYSNFEVVITDDSGGDNSIEDYISNSSFDFEIKYQKNSIPLGSPKNWLESIKLAKGEWVKIMHDDDFFSTPNALSIYASCINNNIDVVFSGFMILNEITNDKKDMSISKKAFIRLKNNPLKLFVSNKLGHPSVLFFRRSVPEIFDIRLKWIVDWEYYIRLFKNTRVSYIKEPLVSVSQNETQLTKVFFRNPSIEIPEIFIFFEKYGMSTFNHILLYDAWWRFMRNMNIRSSNDFKKHIGDNQLPIPIDKIIKVQSYIPVKILSIGIFSKLLMTISYVLRAR